MDKPLRIVGVAILGLLLVAIRYFESELFYDPLISYFKTEHSTEAIPDFENLKLYLNIFLRFTLNTIISLSIIWLIFKNRGVLKVSTLLYVLLFVLLFSAYIVLLNLSTESSDNLILFYVRRFIIQPLFLFILLPAFYFQRKN